MNNNVPVARYEDIVVQELKDEVLVCDTKNNQVFCLNQTAGEVWKLCDGKTKVTEISRILSKKLKTNVGEEIVMFTLDELSNHNLLGENVSTSRFLAGVSRREVIKRIGLSSIVALPLITSVSMPTAAQAQSGACFVFADPCNDDTECCSGCCNFGNCDVGQPAGSPCTTGAECCSGCCSGDVLNPGTCNPGC